MSKSSKSKSGKKSPKTSAAEENVSPFPNMTPYIATHRLPPKPSSEDIDRVFDEVLNDLDLGSSRDRFKAYTTAMKKQFIEDQEAHERKVPAPEWVVEQLQKQCDLQLVQAIGLSLKTGRLEWIDKFCISGGHILLLRELCAFTAYHQTFDNSFRRDPLLRNEILRALRCLVDSRTGSHHLLNFTPGIEVIVQALDRFDAEVFDVVLHILLPFLFMEHGPMYIYRGFQRLAKLNNHRHPFRIFTDCFSSPKIEKKDLFFVFLNGFYAASAGNYKVRQAFDFEFRDSGICRVLGEMPPAQKANFQDKCDSLLEAIQTDLNEISALFGEPVACTSIDDLFAVLKENPRFGNVVMNLFSIAKNQPDRLKEVLDFLSMFLVHYRKTLVCESAPFEQAALKAFDFAASTGGTDDIRLPKSSTLKSNTCYQSLNKEFAFTSDEDLKKVKLDERIGPMQREIEELKASITSLEEALVQEKQKKCEESDEMRKLREELEEVRAENERLQTSQHAIVELLQFIPTDMKPLFLQQIDVGTVIPAKPVDYNFAYKILEQLRKRCPPGLQQEFETLLKAFETQLNSMKQERDTIELNANSMVKTIREERAAANSEFNQIREILAKILESLRLAQTPTAFDDDVEFKGPIKEIPNQAPSAPTRQFLWERLPETCQKYPQWQTIIAQRPTVQEKEIIDLFGIKEIGKGRLLSEATETEYRRVLEKIKKPMEEIAKCVREESFSLGEKELLRILHLPISQVEYDNLVSFNGDINTLDDADKFAVLLHRIPDFRGRVSGVIEHHVFDVEFQVTMQNLNKFSAALEQIKKSTNLNKIIAAVLAVGNVLNGGTGRGGASGFALNDLRELKFMKSNRKKVKLLHYIGNVITRENIDVGDLRKELDRLQTASRLPLSGIMESLKTVQAQLATRPRVPFVVASSRRVLDAMKKVSLVQIEYDKLARSYGVREDLMKRSALIQIILDFAADLSRAIRENAITGWQAELKQKRSSVTISKPVVVDETKSRGLIESMVNTLGAADASASRDDEGEGADEYHRAFAKVRKIVE